MKRNAFVTFALTLGIVFFVVGGISAGSNCTASKAAKAACGANTTTATKVTANDGEEIVVLNVSKMTCGGCANHVTKTLTAVEGVGDIAIDLKAGTATVSYAPAKVKPEMLTAAVVKAGYPTTLATATETQKEMTCDPKDCKKKGCDPTLCGIKTAVKPEGSGK